MQWDLRVSATTLPREEKQWIKTGPCCPQNLTLKGFVGSMVFVKWLLIQYYSSKPSPLRFAFIRSSIRSAALNGSGSMAKHAPTISSNPLSAKLVTTGDPVIFGG